MGFTLVQKYLHVRKTRPAIVIIKSSRIELLERNGKLLRLTALFNFECVPNGKKKTHHYATAASQNKPDIQKLYESHDSLRENPKNCTSRDYYKNGAHTHALQGGFFSNSKEFRNPWLAAVWKGIIRIWCGHCYVTQFERNLIDRTFTIRV